MIKIILNGNEIVSFEGGMKLKLGKELQILGTTYCVKHVEVSTEDFLVYVVHKAEYSKTSSYSIQTGSITADKVNNVGMGVLNTNPFLGY